MHPTGADMRTWRQRRLAVFRRLLCHGLLLLAVVSASACNQAPMAAEYRQESSGDTALANAIRSRATDVRVTGSGTVARVLPDDRRGSRHQRFILQLPSGDTVLVAHNIDLAPRVEPLREGDRLEFAGEYVWNAQGGVVHWTHADPQGRLEGGWLRSGGRTYR